MVFEKPFASRAHLIFYGNLVDLHITARRQHFTCLFPLMIALLASLTFIPVPRQPYLLDDSLSEKTVLSYAHQQGWHFGTDIVFTYGPWGYLVNRHFIPDQYVMQMVVLILLSLLVATGVCLVAWRLTPLWRLLIVTLFVHLTANIDPRTDLIIYSGILCWGWLCLVASGGSLLFCLFCFALIAVFGIMVKANFLFVALISSLTISIDSLLKKRVAVAILLPLALGAFLTLAWLSAGQSLLQLRPFFSNSWLIIQGYDQVVGLDGPATFRTRGLLVTILGLSAIAIRALAVDPSMPGISLGRIPWRTAAVTAWLSLLLFVVWKHAFVRADLYHMGFLFGLVPLLVLSIELLPCSSPNALLFSRCLAVACCAMAVLTVQSLFFSSFKSSLAQPFISLRANLAVLWRPSVFQQHRRQKYEEARSAARLPGISEKIGQSTVDVFGQEQCYAILNNFNYRARPVFQSYLTFNDRLARLNEQFYLSAGAPQYVLFRLNASDRNFPPLEDALLLRHLLLNFSLVMAEAPFLLLESKTFHSAKLKLQHQASASLNEAVPLPENNEGCSWLEVSLEPNWLGRLRQIIYKPAKTRISFWAGDMKKILSRSGAPAPMLRAGFIASPLLLKTQDVSNYLNGTNVIRPAAFSIELSSEAQRYWKPTFLFRVYSVEKEMEVRAKRQGSFEFQVPWQTNHLTFLTGKSNWRSALQCASASPPP